MKSTTVLQIKNMVCPRCIKVVSDELHALGFGIHSIQLGKVEIDTILTTNDLTNISTVLTRNGFELLDNKKLQIIEQVKILIIESIHGGKLSEMHINLSHYLRDKTHMEYTSLSTLFSSIEGKTIERFLILQKIERIKELITYNELNIKEIAENIGYSSLQALSSQFKKETGLTPSEFKKLSTDSRKPISEI